MVQSQFGRRRFVTGAVGVGALVTRGITSAQEASPDASEWSFTDDKDVTITLPARPERLVMDVNAAAPLWDFGIKPTALFGWNVYADGTLGAAGGNIDPEGIPTVGNVNEPLNLEQVIAQDPDLIVTITWSDDPSDYWSIDTALLEQTKAVAPIAAISATGRADVNTGRFAELAAALGADLESEELVAARAEMETSIARLQGVASVKSDLTALFVSAGEDGAVIANPTDWADLNMYMELGVSILEPGVESGAYWLEISNEVAAEYATDIVFISARPGTLTPEELAGTPGWEQHPAVAAGQVFLWNQDFIQSYQGMTTAITGVAEAVERSAKVI
ncbi:MAG: ABC transporter substrate-binding protein [Thermomicrobiales bacterium]|nr:ABC transporter substrate-binding protein [Thermomicrobiales bacterium]